MSVSAPSLCEAEAHPVEAAGSPSDEFLALVPRDFARDHLVLSRGRKDGVEHLRVAPTTDPAAAFNIGVRLGVPIETHPSDPESIARAIDAAYAGRPSPGGSKDEGAAGAEPADQVESILAAGDRDLLSTQGKGPIVKLVDALLFEALGLGASDVHVQPLADRTLVRYRLDGVLHTARELPSALAAPLVSRIKVMGRMDIAERRVPQDGRATVTIGAGRDGRVIDLRISTLPTSYGERAVVRLLETTTAGHTQDFKSLGMPADVQEAYLERAGRSSGIVLVTGPTGSGKTTTLYATLRWIAERGETGPVFVGGLRSGGGLNVVTIEDPIEYELSTAGIALSQAQVNTKKGVTFATGLRHILRQDPDVIMVGEIRDAETARIAIQASLTGHLVFSTLHTNDAASAVSRLVDLGVEPYLIGASLSAVLAQRLVRKIHGACGGRGCRGDETASRRRGVGGCFGTGMLGRTGVFELMVIDEPMRELITHGSSASCLRSAAKSGGDGRRYAMRSLEEEGRRLVESGVTMQIEVERVVHGVT